MVRLTRAVIDYQGLMEEVRRSDCGAVVLFLGTVRDLTGDVIGALGLRIKPNEDFVRILQIGQPGDTGETYAFDPIHSTPGSLQRPHPPILIGGLSDAALRRTVRLGNGWLAVAAPLEQLAERVATLERLAKEAGRRFEDLSLTYKLFVSFGEAKRGYTGERELGTGSVGEIQDDIKRLSDLGFRTIIVRVRGSSAADVASQTGRFVTEIVPKV